MCARGSWDHHVVVFDLTLIKGSFPTKKKITIRDLFVLNRVFFCHDYDKNITNHGMIFFSFSLEKKKKLRFEAFCRDSIFA